MALMLRWGRWEKLYDSNAQMGKMGKNCMAVMLRWGRWEKLYDSNAQMGKMGKTV